MKHIFLLLCLIIFMGNLSVGQDTTTKVYRKPHKSFLVEERPFTIEIPLWIPGFSGNFAFGDFNISGGDGIDPGDPEDPDDDDEGNILEKIFTKKFYLKFFYLNRSAFEYKNFLVQFDALGGGLGEQVKFNYNDKQIVRLELRTINLRLFAGYRIMNVLSQNEKFRYELYTYGGARYHNHKIKTEFLDNKIIYDISPGWFEPVIGIQNQFSLERWFFVAQGDMGGFYIDSKYSFQVSMAAYYRTGRAISLKLGWNILDLNHRTTHLGEDLKVDLTMSGPAIGVAIHF